MDDSKKYQTDVIRKVWDNHNGIYAHVQPDKDGLDLVLVAFEGGEMLFYPEMAKHVAAAMNACADEIIAAREVG